MTPMTTTKTDTLDELANALKLPILKRLPELIEPDSSVEENLLYILRLEYKEKSSEASPGELKPRASLN